MPYEIKPVERGSAKSTALGISTRVDYLVWQLYKGKQHLFASASGISRATVSTVMKGGIPSAETLIQILVSHRFINPYWLLLGEGEMLTPDAPSVPLV